MLEIKNLTAGYGAINILHDVNISVGNNEVVALIGPNGAGKSTVLRSVFQMTKIRDGEVSLAGKNIVGMKTYEIVSEGISYVPQGRSTFGALTAEENLEMGAFIRTDNIKSDLEYVYSRFPILYERRKQKAKTMSGGEQQILAIGRALMLRPKILLLDEPSIGLAPKIIEEVFTKIEKIRQDGASILMVEQNAVFALNFADRGYVLELGKNVLEGSGHDLLANKKVGELYLGKE